MTQESGQETESSLDGKATTTIDNIYSVSMLQLTRLPIATCFSSIGHRTHGGERIIIIFARVLFHSKLSFNVEIEVETHRRLAPPK